MTPFDHPGHPQALRDDWRSYVCFAAGCVAFAIGFVVGTLVTVAA